MEFDIISMKQMAKRLMSHTKPSPFGAGCIYAFFDVLYFVLMVLFAENEYYWAILLAAELLFLNIRSSCRWYGLKVAREENVTVSDSFLAFKEKVFRVWGLGLVKEVCYLIGAACLVFGLFLPLYWFRMSVYILRDEEINPLSALGKSMKLLKGHYKELIKLDVSNLGWFALWIFTGGIAGFYVKPYLSIIYAEFYDYLKAQKEMFGQI